MSPSTEGIAVKEMGNRRHRVRLARWCHALVGDGVAIVIAQSGAV